MKKKKLIILGVIMCAMLISTACGKASNSDVEVDGETVGEVIEDEVETSGEVNEDYFEWDGNKIIGITSSGAKQTTLIIPERCEEFSSYLFNDLDCDVKNIIFESDADIDLNGAFQQV